MMKSIINSKTRKKYRAINTTFISKMIDNNIDNWITIDHQALQFVVLIINKLFNSKCDKVECNKTNDANEISE